MHQFIYDETITEVLTELSRDSELDSTRRKGSYEADLT